MFRKYCNYCDEIVDDEIANKTTFNKSYHTHCMDKIKDHSFKCIKYLESYGNIDIVRMILKFISGTNFINL